MRMRQLDVFEQDAQPRETFEGIVTMGTVVDVNDPSQMGRVRVVCPTLGEDMTTPINDLPWAIYVSPFAGVLDVGDRGPEEDQSQGAISYGFWSPPQMGAQLLIMFLDGDPNMRVYLGGIYDQFRPHTMPHGRWMYDDHPTLEKWGVDPRPFGPYTSNEKFIEPLNKNLREAFPKGEPNYEWRNRAADYQDAAIDIAQLEYATSNAPDDKNIEWDEWLSTQGYNLSRQDPTSPSLFGEGNLSNQTYSWTSPGFHAVSMDDRIRNCRMRFRTTAGHQILLDDTNERIYIATAKGKNWIEIDQEGNIDMFTTNKVNIHAEKDINLTSDKTIRMFAKEGIHMYSEDEIRMQAKKDVNFKFEQNWRVHVTQGTYVLSDQDMNFKTGTNMYLEAAQNIEIKAGSALNLTSGADTNQNAGGNIIETASAIHHNGPTAATAASATDPSEQPAFWTSRVPEHEPWARVMTKDDFTHDPEFPYDSKQVNRNERGQTIPRGTYWRR